MDDHSRVRGRQRAGDLNRDRQGFAHGQRSPGEPLPQRLAVDELAEDERLSVQIAEIVDDQDVRMVQRGHRACFSVETAQSIGIRCDLRR